MLPSPHSFCFCIELFKSENAHLYLCPPACYPAAVHFCPLLYTPTCCCTVLPAALHSCLSLCHTHTHSREEVEQALRVSRNSAELLQEMLAPVKASADRAGLHETFVTDLADQCYRCVRVCVFGWGGVAC